MQNYNAKIYIHHNNQIMYAKIIDKTFDIMILETNNTIPYNSSSTNEVVFISIFKPDNITVHYSGIIHSILENQIKISSLKLIIDKERRKDIKTKFSQKGKIISIKNQKGIYFPVNFIDISAGGIRFTSISQLDINDIFETNISLDNNQLLLTIIILREYRVLDDNIFNYGCKFKNITPKDDEIIRQYVFQNEARIIKR